jgi:hypothetical protein
VTGLLNSVAAALLQVALPYLLMLRTKDETLIGILVFSLVVHRLPILNQSSLYGATDVKGVLARFVIALDAAGP